VKEEMVIGIHRVRVGTYQVMSDGRTVWVNGPDGASVARLSAFGPNSEIVSIDVHRPRSEQCATGNECLDCRKDLVGARAWFYFTESLRRNFGVRVDKKHRPNWSKPKGKKPHGKATAASI
jgi:hypothetical protein